MLTLLAKSALGQLTPPFQRFRVRAIRFSYRMQYVPVKSIETSDTFSRALVSEEEPAKMLSCDEVQPLTVEAMIGLRSFTLDRVEEAQEKVQVYQRLLERSKSGWLAKQISC